MEESKLSSSLHCHHQDEHDGFDDLYGVHWMDTMSSSSDDDESSFGSGGDDLQHVDYQGNDDVSMSLSLSIDDDDVNESI